MWVPFRRKSARAPQAIAAFLLGLAAALLPVGSWAGDFIAESAYWTDTSGTASFEQARSEPYIPYSHVLSKGYSADVQWIRLKIGAVPAGGGDSLVLRLRPVYLDEITLFDPAEPTGGLGVRTTGDWTSWHSTEFESLHHTFLIPAKSSPRYVWLRLVTNSTQLLHVEALAPREMLRQEHTLWLVYSALLALILSFLIWVFLAWVKDRDPVNGAFALRQVVLLIYTASYLGYHRIVLAGVIEPRSQDILYNWLVMLTTALSLIFEYRFLREYVLPRWGHLWLRTLVVCSALAMSLLLAGHTRSALNLNMVLNAVILLSLLVVAWRIQPPASGQGDAGTYQLPKQAVAGYYITIIGVLALSILPSLGVLQGSMLSIYGVLLYGLISGLLMTSLLIVRSRQIERVRLEMANHLFLSREQLVIEQKRRQDQSQLLSMLMHELKTPLSVIDMAVTPHSHGSQTTNYVSRAVDNIKSILDRCIQTDRMVEREFRLDLHTVHLSDQLHQCLQDSKEGAQRFDAHIAPDLQVNSDLQCVLIIINNLIENALKHGDAQARIGVALSPALGSDARPGILLTVSSWPGPSGWPEADKLFGKYYRSPSAQRKSGTGLGLYLSAKLAGLLGGTLTYRPDGDNIRFELWLPN
jgi:signal transduction histidine kinase